MPYPLPASAFNRWHLHPPLLVLIRPFLPPPFLFLLFLLLNLSCSSTRVVHSPFIHCLFFPLSSSPFRSGLFLSVSDLVTPPPVGCYDFAVAVRLFISPFKGPPTPQHLEDFPFWPVPPFPLASLLDGEWWYGPFSLAGSVHFPP